MADFKQLCRDLMDALDSGIPGTRIQGSPLAERARAALSEPEPEESPQPVPVLPEGTPIIEPPDHTLLAPIAQPIPVSERLPGAEDCDGEGRCWWGEPQIGDSHDATWNLCTQDEAEDYCTWGTKCGWLPANALPLPAFLDGDCDKTATPEDQ